MDISRDRSFKLFESAQAVIPGGVNSPVRAFRAVGGNPPFIASGCGPWMTDEDGNRFLDCIGSWGPLMFGHAHPAVMKAVQDQLARGWSYGAPTALEVEMANAIVDAVPSVEMVRLVSSGTEATMAAIRVARGYTGRSGIVKFEGNYHGHADFLLAKAGSGVATFGLPECAGVPPAATADTMTLPFNDISALQAAFTAHGNSIACVIVEPVAGNMGCVPPAPGFLQALRDVTNASGAVLIFDEVMTGFRLAYGGAQQRFGITPDMTAMGKVLGGGMPLGAYGGRIDIMRCVAPVGPVYQAGTLSGNPLAVTAGLATLELCRQNNYAVYRQLDEVGARVANVLREAAHRSGVPVTVQQVGSMITVFFTREPSVNNYTDARKCNTDQFGTWHAAMLSAGVYWPPSQFEAAFLSSVITENEVDLIASAAGKAFDVVATAGAK